MGQDYRDYGADVIARALTTYYGKALAAASIQDRYYAQDSLALCDAAQELKNKFDQLRKEMEMYFRLTPEQEAFRREFVA